MHFVRNEYDSHIAIKLKKCLDVLLPDLRKIERFDNRKCNACLIRLHSSDDV